MQSNVAQLLRQAAISDPHRIALVEASSGHKATWRELDALADAVAAGLADAGVLAGYRLGLALGNRIEFVAAYLGALRARVVVCPLNPRGTTEEYAHLATDAGLKLILADESTVEPARATGRPVLCVGRAAPLEGELSWADLISTGRAPVDLPDDPEALAVLLYTSGTTGRPRGAMLTHRALLANIAQVAEVRPKMIQPNDVVFGVLPLFHVYGLNAVLGQVLHTRARLVLVESFDPEEALNIIEDEAVTVLPVAPPVLAHWRDVPGLGDRLEPVRMVLSGSAPLSPDLVAVFSERTGLQVQQGYGLTEAAPVVTSTLCSRTLQPGSVGAALPGIEIRLRGEDGAEPAGEDPGEIRIKGANLFSGYWPDGVDGPGEDGWYSTGDVGFLDPAGDLFLVDRVKELVIVSGFNVYPTEVEEAIASLPEVAEAAVIGVPDERTGEAVVAYVRPSNPADADRLPDLVRDRCAERLARFKRPTQVHVVDRFPLTITGKVQKGRLRSVARRQALGLLE